MDHVCAQVAADAINASINTSPIEQLIIDRYQLSLCTDRFRLTSLVGIRVIADDKIIYLDADFRRRSPAQYAACDLMIREEIVKAEIFESFLKLKARFAEIQIIANDVGESFELNIAGKIYVV